jgi:alpha-L-arabinofuranosidase
MPWAGLRVARGHPEPYQVQTWSLGNELGYGHMEGPNTPRAYAHKARACAEAMKGVDPTISLVSSGTWQREEWFTEGLASLAPVIEHISHHSYTPQLRRYTGTQAIEDLRSLMAGPAHDFAAMRGIRGQINAYAPQGRFIGISFDEWNVWYAWYRTPGVAEGLYAAMMLNLLCREAEALGVTIGCYFQPVNEGAIVVQPDQANLTPVGQALRLFRAHHGHTAVEVSPFQGGQPVDASASVDPVTGHLLVTLVNVSPEREIRAKLDIRGMNSPQQVGGRLLYGDDILPGSILHETYVTVATANDGSAEVILPAYGMALVEFMPGSERR